MKKIYLLSDADGLQWCPYNSLDELKKRFFNKWEIEQRRYKDSVKDHTVWCIEFNSRKYWFDWWYGDFRMFERENELDAIDFEEYQKHWIKRKEIKKDFLYRK